METNCPLNIMRNLEEVERDKKKKKRGRRDEEQEDFYHDYYLHPSAEKQDTTEHCNNSVRRKTKDSSSCSKDDSSESYISSENHVALGIFDFPWMHEGIVSKLEDWYYIEDTFSQSLEDTCFRSQIKFYECLSETSPATSLTNFDEDKRVFNESADGHRLEIEGADCNWGSLLDHPLQRCVPNPNNES